MEAYREEKTQREILTQRLQIEMDKVDAVILHCLVRFGGHIQVAIALLVADVHLDLCSNTTH